MERDEFEAWLATVTGGRARLVALRPLAGGASMETLAAQVSLDGAAVALVVRRDMGANMYSGALTRAQEFQVITAARARGVRAPAPRWLYEGPGRAFFVMDWLEGESVGRRVVSRPELAGARAVLATQMGAELARIHGVPLDAALDFLARPAPGQSPAEAALASIRGAVDELRLANPVWELALRRLERSAPGPSGPVTLLHGDFRVGNLLVTPAGLNGVLDWEFAHVGDPLDDLAWPLVRDWRFERDELPVGGVGSLDDFLAGYTGAGGRAVDRGALRWWEALGNLRWAVFCHKQAARHLAGTDRSVELASLGRKAAEVEWELVRLLTAMEARR